MPIAGFKCRICLVQFPLDAIVSGRAMALDHFEGAHVDQEYTLNRDITYTLANRTAADNEDPRRNGLSFTASMTGCTREAVLARTETIWLDPLKLWSRLEGTLIHESLDVAPPWNGECLFEGDVLGIPMSGRADRVKPGAIKDIKSHGCPPGRWSYVSKEEKALGKRSTFEYYRTVYAPDEGGSEQVQLNVLARLAGMPDAELGVTVIQKGVKDPTLATREFPVAMMTDEALAAIIRPKYENFKRAMSEPDLVERRKIIATMPLEGREMLKGRDGSCKCDKWCDVRGECDALLPEKERF